MGTGCFVASRGSWSLTVALPDAAPATRANAVGVIDAFAVLLREMTWGRMALGEVSLVVSPYGLGAADIVFSPGARADAAPGGLGRPGSFIQVDSSANSPLAQAAKLMHEFGHYAFGLGDEYRDVSAEDGARKEVADCRCIMADLTAMRFCDMDHAASPANSQNTAHHGLSCRSVMARRYPSLGSRATGPLPANLAPTYFDVLPSWTVVLTHCKDATPATVGAVQAIAAVWTAVARVSAGELKVLASGATDPMQAIFSGFAAVDWNRRHVSQALLLVGFPSSKGLAAKLTGALARGKGIPVHAVSPTEPAAPLRDFALATGGACEVVVRTGIEADVDLRIRLLCRLARGVDGFGIGLLRRVLATSSAPARATLRVESGANSALFAICLPSGAAATVSVTDPSGRAAMTQATDDGTIVWTVVEQPMAGDWALSVSLAGSAPIGCVGLIHNPRVSVEPARTLGAYRPGQSIDLTSTLVVPAAPPLVAAPMSVHLPPSAAMADSNGAASGSDWNDGVVASTSEFTTAKLAIKASWRGYADCRIDFRVDQPGAEAVVRVLPFQLRVVAGARAGTERRNAEHGEG